MQICHITSAHPRYDIRIFVKECQSLARNNHQVSLIVADDLADEIHHINAMQSINIYNVDKESGRFSRMWKTPQKIYRKILELKPEVVHFHDPELMLIALKLQKLGFKVIYDVHEDLPKQIQNKYWLPQITRNLVSISAKLFEQYIAARISGVVTATPIIAQRFQKYNKSTIIVCNYPLLQELGSDTSSHFQEHIGVGCSTPLNLTAVDFSERENTLCYIGSISKTRGIVPLIESLALSKTRLKLAGKFSGDLDLSELKKIPGFEFVDYLKTLDREHIAKLLSQVKIGIVTLLPTPSYVESLPIKMFEYMLAGIPVVASNFPLWIDIIKTYNCGLMADPNNPEEISKACQHLLDNQDIAEQMGKNGRDAVIKYFNWEQEESKLISFYNELKTPH